jgi:hypothetical protein
MSDFQLPPDLVGEILHPDIHSLFQHYSDLYFSGDLGACSVEWSSGRMTRWAHQESVFVWHHSHPVSAAVCCAWQFIRVVRVVFVEEGRVSGC